MFYIGATSLSFKSLITELWDYIKANWFTVDMGEYEHFSFGSGTLTSARAIIIGICIGIVIAVFASMFDRRKYGDFVRKIISEECFDKDSAKTLDELGYGRSSAIRSNLRSGTILKKYVKCVGEVEYLKKCETEKAEFDAKNAENPIAPKYKAPAYKIDFSTDKFYIPENDKYAADVKFDKNGSGWRSAVLAIVVAVVICAIVTYVLPDMLQLLDNFLGMI